MLMLDDGYEAVVLSDYAKGVLDAPLCRRLIERCRERGVPVLVDPKGLGYEKYAGATTITPNEGELAVVSDAAEHDRDALTAGGQRPVRGARPRLRHPDPRRGRHHDRRLPRGPPRAGAGS